MNNNNNIYKSLTSREMFVECMVLIFCCAFPRGLPVILGNGFFLSEPNLKFEQKSVAKLIPNLILWHL